MAKPFNGQPMDLGNMRSLGVLSVAVSCDCGHRAFVDVSPLPDSLAVPMVRERLRCGLCGQRPSETRPNWLEYHAAGGG